MLLENNVPKDISASITDVLGPCVTTTIRRLVRVEVKPDKHEQKVLVLSNHRIYIFSNKAPTKEEVSIHFLELQGIESKDIKLTFKYEGKKLVLYAIDNPNEIDQVVFQIADSLLQIFPHMTLEKLTGPLDISPPERMKNVKEQLKDKTMHREVSPCGNFSVQYHCMCERYNQPYLEEVAWDVDTIYLSQNCKTLMLSDFDHIDNKHLTPIISALAHNTWFTTMCACNVKMSQETTNEYANVLKTNTAIENICAMNSGIKSDVVQKIANALTANIKDTAVNSFDLMNNAIEDKGVQALSYVIGKLSKGVIHINLSKCRITSVGVNKLAEALCNNPRSSETLTHLDLSSNSFRDDITYLQNFLAQPNKMTSLNLSGTECALENIFGAMCYACMENLTHLDLSGNTFSNVKSRGKQSDVMVPMTWKKYFAETVALQSVSVANTRLPLDAIKNILLGINSNPNLKDVCVNLCNTGLGTMDQGSQLLEMCVGDNVNIADLDISDNDLNIDLTRILQKMAKNNTLKKLNISKNTQGLKTKYIPDLLNSVVEVLNAEDSALESLFLADSKLRNETVIVINALGGNASLTELDISGNNMGDYGARMLSKALAINTKLQVIHWDRNNITPQGYSDISSVLSKNFTLRKIPTPIIDVTNALKVNQDKTTQSLHKIEECLRRNNSPRKYGSEQAYRLQQGFLLSSTQQTVDKYIVQLLDSISDLEKGDQNEDDVVKSDIEKAKYLMKDAENCRQLILQLQKIGLKCEAAGNNTEIKLMHMSDDLQHHLTKQTKLTTEQMVQCTEGKGLSILDQDNLKDTLKSGCTEKSQLPSEFCKTLLLEQVATEIYNKMNEVNVSIASHISEELIDLLIESLDKCHTDLANHKSSESQLDQEARKSIFRSKDKQEEVRTDPVISRKSVYSRKVRPVSTLASESLKPQETGTESELDDFVFVPSDEGTDDDGTHKLSSTKQKQTSLDVKASPSGQQPKDQLSPAPSPRASAQGTSVAPSKHVLPPKPPAPVIVKKPSSSTPTTKYIYQGEKFTPSPERPVSSGDKPRPAPRRRHGKPEDSIRLSEMSVSDDSPSVSTRNRKSTDSLISVNSANENVKEQQQMPKSSESGDVTLPKVENVSAKPNLERKSSSPKKASPPIPDTSLDPELSSEDDDKEDKSTGGDLTDTTTTDTGSVDSLLEPESPPEKAKPKEGKQRLFKSVPKDKAKEKLNKDKTTNKTVPKSSVSDFDALTNNTAPKLEHLALNKPKRTKTRPTMPGKIAIRSDSDVIEEGNNDISDFYDTKSVTKQHMVPTDSVKQKEQEMNMTNSIEHKQKPKKKALLPPGIGVKNISSGISNFFKRNKDEAAKSPEESNSSGHSKKESSPTKVASQKNSSAIKPEVKSNTSKESSPDDESIRTSSAEKEVEQNKDESEQEKSKEDKPPEKPPGPRLPPGARAMPMMGGPGGGAALLAEMKLKKQSIMKSDNSKEPSPSKDTKLTAPARPPSLYPKLPSDVSPKPPLATRSASTSDENRKSDGASDHLVKLPDKPPPPTRPKPGVKQSHPPLPSSQPPARPTAGPTRASTMKTVKQPAPAIPSNIQSNNASRGYSDPDDTSKPADSSDTQKETNSVKRRSSIKDRIAMLDANSNEKSNVSSQEMVAVGKGSPKTKPRPLSTNLLKESQDKNVDDTAGTESRPKSKDLDSRPKSMFTGSSSAMNTELHTRSHKAPAPPRPLSNVSESSSGKEESSPSTESKTTEKEESRKSGSEEIYL